MAAAAAAARLWPSLKLVLASGHFRVQKCCVAGAGSSSRQIIESDRFLAALDDNDGAAVGASRAAARRPASGLVLSAYRGLKRLPAAPFRRRCV
jgi:hypothetical protein